MDNVFDLIEPHGVLTEEVLFGLEQMFGGRMITEVSRLRAHELTAEIITRRGVLFPKEVPSLDVATALLDAMRRLEITDSLEVSDSAKPVPTAPSRQPSTDKDANWCRKQLKAHADDSFSMSGDLRLGRTIKNSVTTMSGSVRLDETIILKEIYTMSGDIRGTAYVGPKADISTMSGNIRANIKQLSWEQLYDKAVESGLI